MIIKNDWCLYNKCVLALALALALALFLALALACVINYDRELHHNLERHLLTTLVIIYSGNMFIIQATGCF